MSVLGGRVLLTGVLLVLLTACASYPDIVTPHPVLGNVNASVHVIEYSDMECPACRQAYATMHVLLDKYNDSISFEYKHFPLSQHRHSYKAAIAAECANDYGQYYAFLERAFTNPDLDGTALKAHAILLGIPEQAFSACLSSATKQAVVDENVRSGIKLGITETPSFFVNGKNVKLSQLEGELQRLLT
ncbi:MAG: thioredoxin domain-containing protein [archaeon]